MHTSAQCRMARAALQWSLDDVAARAGVNRGTVWRFEFGQGKPNKATLSAIRQAFEAAGVEFTDGEQPGVRLKAGTPSS